MIVHEYYQTEDFTCGPAVLLTGMRALNPNIILSKEEEYLIWHESNSIFTGEGHPGCGIYGLALSAMKRGFLTKISLNLQGDNVLFLDWVAKGLRRDIYIWNEYRFHQLFLKAGGKEDFSQISILNIMYALESGGIVICLISDSVYDQNSSHWVTIESMNKEKTIYFDPYRDKLYSGKRVVLTDDFFNKLMCYGAKKKKACLYLYNQCT